MTVTVYLRNGMTIVGKLGDPAPKAGLEAMITVNEFDGGVSYVVPGEVIRIREWPE